MKKNHKRALRIAGALVAAALLGIGVFVLTQVSAFDASMDRVYEVPVPTVARSRDPAVIERGRHLADAVAACTAALCHGADLGGGRTIEMVPVASLTAPNVTPAGLGATYTDGELARLIKHGLKRDGRSVRFMPAHESGWLSDDDVAAVVSFVRSVAPVERPNGVVQIGTLGKVLDRRGQVVMDVARRIDHERIEAPPAPAPTAEYGRFIARLCLGCHGDRLSGGPIPGAPSDFATPANLTPDPTGLGDWTFEDFDRVLAKGIKKNGQPVDKLMPTATLAQMNDLEKHALWEYLRTLPPLPHGNR